MKSLRIFLVASICMAFTTTAIAQQKTESFKVSGQCGMCKKTIEKSAKTAGASFAEWNKQTKVLTVKYNSNSTNPAKIQKMIAGAGYDTPDFKATQEAYNNLEECCQYKRGEDLKMNCCDDKCTEACKGTDKSCCSGGASCCKNQEND